MGDAEGAEFVRNPAQKRRTGVCLLEEERAPPAHITSAALAVRFQ